MRQMAGSSMMPVRKGYLASFLLAALMPESVNLEYCLRSHFPYHFICPEAHLHGLPTLLPNAHTTIHTRPHLPHLHQDLTLRAKDSLVSFGERLSTRIFASYLRANGVPAQQVGGSGQGLNKF